MPKLAPPHQYFGKYFKHPSLTLALPFLQFSPQPEPIDKFVPRLKVDVYKHQKLSAWPDTRGRQLRLRTIINDLTRYERIEVYRGRAHEVQPYFEYILQDAIRFGACHKPTMELASFWFHDQDLVHKLFKVLVPRFKNYATSFTRMHKLPLERPGLPKEMVVLELKGNPFPPVRTRRRNVSHSLTNILLSHARDDFYTKHSDYLEQHLETSAGGSSASEAQAALASGDTDHQDDAVPEQTQETLAYTKNHPATVVRVYDPSKLEKFDRDVTIPVKPYNPFKGPSAPGETSGATYTIWR